jgi:uncharacterized protein (TIGR03437 family)
MAVVNGNAFGGTVTILLGNGAGGFTASGTVPVGDAPQAIAAGDFNGDGALDLVVANYQTRDSSSPLGTVSVLLGDGHSGFRTAPGNPLSSPLFIRPVAIVASDFNRDGKLDLAVGSLYGGVAVWMGNGTGAFTLAVGSPFSAGTGPFALAVADFNGDGRPDLAITETIGAPLPPPNPFHEFEQGTRASVWLGNGSGGFTAAPGSPFAVGTTPLAVVTGDLNSDGKPDLVFANTRSNNVTILLGNGLGGFTPAPASPLPAGAGPSSLALADLNGDGFLDLAIGHEGYGDLIILLGNGFGGFTQAFGRALSSTQTRGEVTADFNGDGRVDLVTIFPGSPGTVSVWLGAATPTTTLLSTTVSAVLSPGETVPLRAQVIVSGTYFASPNGTVTFQDGSTKLASLPLSSSGTAAFDVVNASPGNHTFTAVYSGDSRTAASTSNALSFAPLPIQISGVVNAASFQPGIAAPNTILSLFGLRLDCAPSPQVALNGVLAEILAATETQINFVVPAGLPTGSLSLQVNCGPNRSQPYPLPSAVAAPALFTASLTGVGQAAVMNQDGSLNGPLAPAPRGSYVSLFATGLGPYAEAGPNGLKEAVLPVTVFFADTPGSLQFAGAAPEFTLGLQQINVQVPTEAPTGDVALRLTVGTVGTQQALNVAIK